jgi:hypothetical protein
MSITSKPFFKPGPVLFNRGPFLGMLCFCKDIHQPLHYFFAFCLFASGGKCLNIFSTPLLRFLMFLSELLERVLLDEPRKTSSFD